MYTIDIHNNSSSSVVNYVDIDNFHEAQPIAKNERLNIGFSAALPICDGISCSHSCSHVDINDITAHLQSKPWFEKKGMKKFHLNVHYLYPKLDEIKLILSQHNVDILCLCETFLNETFSNNEVSIENYKLFRKDRQTNGGGLVIYVRDDIPCEQLTCFGNSLESLWVQIKQPNSKSFVLSCVYRPPSSKVQWMEDFSVMLENPLLIEKECIILGDFNIDLQKGDTSSKSWLGLMESVNFSQLVKDSTRVTEMSATLIDHAFVNTPQNISSVIVPNFAISDHYPVCLTRKIASSYVKGPVHKTITYRSMKRFDENKFLTDLSCLPWFLIDSCTDPDDAGETFLYLFNYVLNNHAPQRKRRVKRANQPNWISSEIIEAIKLFVGSMLNL